MNFLKNLFKEKIKEIPLKPIQEQMTKKSHQVFDSRVNINQFISGYDEGNYHCEINMIQLYQGSDWYQFIYVSDIPFLIKRSSTVTSNKILSITLPYDLEVYKKGKYFKLSDNGLFKCTIEDIRRDECDNIFIKLKKEPLIEE